MKDQSQKALLIFSKQVAFKFLEQYVKTSIDKLWIRTEKMHKGQNNFVDLHNVLFAIRVNLLKQLQESLIDNLLRSF